MTIALTSRPSSLLYADQLNYYTLHSGGYIIPTYFDTYSLEVAPSATNGTVTVSPGAAVCYQRFYTSDADVDILLDSSAANNRIDRIVLRNNASNAIRLTVIKGTEAASPAIPALTYGDVPIAWVWIPAGWNAATTVVADTDVHDDRIFSDVGISADSSPRTNLLYNPEFMAYSGGTAGTLPPEGWRITVAPATDITSITPLTKQLRGWSVRIRANAGQGMETSLRLNSVKVPQDMFTLRGCLSVTSGSALITVDGTVAKEFFPLAAGSTPFYFAIRVPITNNTTTITVEANSAGSNFTLGQMAFCAGYLAPFSQKHEIIMLDQALTDAGWTATAKSTSTPTLTLNTSFGNLVPKGARGLIVRLRCNDSGSAAGSASLYASNYLDSTAILSRVRVDGLPNDSVREAVGYLPIFQSSGLSNIRIGCEATGVGTLDATVEIIGIIT